MELSDEQYYAFYKYSSGKNIFITGPGGSGKSELIKKIYADACEKEKEIYVCALTGCAAVLLGCKAKTLHSWSGIGLGNQTIADLIKKIKKNSYLREIWISTDILVIDEVSMLSAKLFEMLNSIGKAIRKNEYPFGGIQLLLFGDFYQLPPVGEKDDPKSQKFCFESEEWNTIFTKDCQIQLVKIFRQKDQDYTTILNQIRQGKITRSSIELLHGYVGRNVDSSLITQPTKLFPTRKKVDSINNIRLQELNGDEKIFTMNTVENFAPSCIASRDAIKNKDIQMNLEFISKNLICDKEIKLKIGAQVMCIINIMSDVHSESDKNKEIILCNGSQGIITGFCDISGYPIVKYNNGIKRIMSPHVWVCDKYPEIGISQIPLILAWALTIHKSQGATLDAAEIDIGSCIFEYDQTYVALSRVKNLNGLYLSSFDHKKIRVNKKVKEYYKGLSEKEEEKEENKNLSK